MNLLDAIYKVIQEKAEILSQNVVYGQWCISNPVSCILSQLGQKILNDATNLVSNGAFSASNLAMKAAGNAIFDLGKSLTFSVDQNFKSLTGVDPHLYATVAKAYSTAALNMNYFDKEITKLIVPNPAENAAPFRASQLIPPLLLHYFVSKNFSQHLTNITESGKRLFNLIGRGQRTVLKEYTVYARNWEPIKVSHIKNYTIPSLLWELGIESFFALMWGSGTYITSKGMIDALTAAGASPQHAQLIVVAATLMSSAPSIFSRMRNSHTVPNNKTQDVLVDGKPMQYSNKQPSNDEDSTIEWDSEKKDWVLKTVDNKLASLPSD